MRWRALTLAGLGLALATACTVEEKNKPTGGDGGSDAGTQPDAAAGGQTPGTGGDRGISGAGGASGAGMTTDGGVDGGTCEGDAAIAGSCDGTEVVFCDHGKVSRVDCATIGATCAVTGGRADCSTANREAGCGNLTAKGTCDGAVIKYCDESGLAAVARDIDCAAYGQLCDPTGAKDGGAICVPQGKCPSGLDENGTCEAGNQLTFCEGGDQYTFDCGVDTCQTMGGLSDCFVTGAADGCGTETAAGRCDGKTRVSCQSGVVAREECDTLGLECRAATGGGFRCLPPTTCGTCPKGTACTSGRCTPSKAPTAEWTFMVYMIANNNLSQAAWADLNEMETVGTSKSVNVVAEVKFSQDYSYNIPSQYLNDSAFRMEVDPDSDTSDVSSLQSSETTKTKFNMSDPTAVSEFVQWAVETHPAKHYALVMWNHGAGYKEAFVDGSSLMTLKDLVTGVRDSSMHLDLVGFDACLMGMHDVAYAMHGVADYMVGSEEVEPGAGYPYDDILSGLAAKPTMDAATLGTLIVDKYAASYVGGHRPQDVTSALYDLSKIEATNEQLSSVADALKGDSVGSRAALRTSIDGSDVLRFTQKEDADLVTVLGTLGGLQLGTASQTATSDMSTYLTDPKNVVLHASASGDLSAAKGLAVFLPQGATGGYYGTDVLEGYKSRVSFLPMQPWISFVSGLSDDSTPPPKPGTGAVDSFSVVLSWASTVDGQGASNADLDLYVFEPSGDFGTPSNGTVSGSGLLSGDSYDTGVPQESYSLATTHEIGTYVVLAHFYDGPKGEVAYPTLQVIRPDLPGGSRTLIRAKPMDRELMQIPMDNSKPLTTKIDSTNFDGVVNLDYSNLWYATTIEVK